MPFLFAILYWASFHPLNLGFLGWFALVPLLVYAKVASGAKSFFLAWLAGAVCFAACFFWVRYTVPIAPYLLGIYKGFYVAAFVLVVRRTGPLWAPAVWTALEFARGRFFGGLPWFNLGYTQHDALRLIQIADLGGVWLVTALVAFVNAALVDGRRAPRLAAAGALAAAMVYGAIRVESIPMHEGPKVAVIQPNIPQDVKEGTVRDARGRQIDPLKEAMRVYQIHLDLTVRAGQEKPDLVVWPEASIYHGLEWLVPQQKWLPNYWYHRVITPGQVTGARTVIGLLAGDRTGQKVVYTNSAVYVDPIRGITDRFDKVHLVPFAEFVPLSERFPWIRDLVHKYSGLYLENMRPGAGFPIWDLEGTPFGTQICFEAIFPEISREIARNGAAFTVNISNDGWFRDSAELDQMQAMARFRAIENRIHFIRATNTGISAFIEPTGRVQAILPGKEVEGVLVARPRVTGASSLFRAWGAWAAWTAVLGALGGWIGRIFVDSRKKVP